MPRKPADQVIEHRISLQDAERTLLLKPVNEILTDVQQFTEQANTMRQVATYGALALGAGALFVLPRVWSTTARVIAGVGDVAEDVGDFLDSPFKSTMKKLDQEAKDFTKWLFGLDDLPDWANR